MARRPKIDINSLPSNNKMPTNREPVDIQGSVSRGSSPNFASYIRDMANALFQEIIMPEAKSTGLHYIFSIVESLVYREEVSRSYKRQPYERQSYNSRYRGRKTRQFNRAPTRRHIGATQRRFAQVEEPNVDIFEDFYFESRQDAEAVLGRMMEYVADYGRATVGDLYSLVSMNPSITHERYGWTDLRGVSVLYTSDGFVIDFPNGVYFN